MEEIRQDDVRVVLITVPATDNTGKLLAGVLVREGLAACVNRLGPVYSTYRWEGRVVEEDEEGLLIVKTTADRMEALTKRVRELHPYSEPEIIALPVTEGSESYLKWVRTSRGE